MREFPQVNTGFAKATEDEAVAAVKGVMQQVMGNEILLHSVVAGGLTHWMNAGAHAFSGLAVDDQVLRDMFHYFQAHADADPKKKLDELLKAAVN